MSATDYILALLAIVTGLAVCDMIVSLHGLLINRRNIKWDWLALVAAAFVLVMIINTWRLTYVAFQGAERGPPIWVFLLVLTQNIGLYLAARAALPDRIKVGQVMDLREYYDFVDRYLWGALLVSYCVWVFLQLLALAMFGKMSFPQLFVHALTGSVAILALVVWPTRKVHQIVVPMLFIWLCVRVLPERLLVV